LKFLSVKEGEKQIFGIDGVRVKLIIMAAVCCIVVNVLRGYWDW